MANETSEEGHTDISLRPAIVNCSAALVNLESVEREYVLNSSSKDKIRAFRLDLKFLETILKYEDIDKRPSDEDWVGLMNDIAGFVMDAKLSFAVARHSGDGVRFDLMFRDIEGNIEVIKARAKEYYYRLLVSSSGCQRLVNIAQAPDILAQLQENLGVLMSYRADLKKEIEGFVKTVSFLGDFLEFMAHCIDTKELRDLSPKIVAAVDYATLACVSFFFLSESVTESAVYREKQRLHLSLLLQKMKNIKLELNEIFTGLRYASKLLLGLNYSNLTKRVLAGQMLSFLLQNLTHLLVTNKVGFNSPTMDHVQALQKALKILTNSYIDPLESVIKRIEAVKSAILSLDDKKIQNGVVREMRSLSVSRLQEDVKLMYEEGTLDYTTYQVGKGCSMVDHFGSDPLQCREWQEVEKHRSISEQCHIIIDKDKLRRIVMRCKRILNFKTQCIRNASIYLEDEVKNDMHAICIAIKYGMLDGAYFHLSKLQFYLCDVEGYSYILNNESLLELLDSLLGNLVVLRLQFDTVQEKIQVLVDKLRVLRDAINFTSEERIEKDGMCSFLNKIKSLCIESISLSCQWYKRESQWPLYDLTAKINRIEKEVRELSLEILKLAVSSKSKASVMIEPVLVVFYLVQDDIGKLLNNTSSWAIHFRSRIDSLYKSLAWLWSFFKGSLKQFARHKNFNNLFDSVAIFLIKTESLVHYSYPMKLGVLQAKEIDSMLMDLILAMKLIRAQFTLLEMLNPKAISSGPLQEDFETLHTGLKFVIMYLIDLPRQYTSHEKYDHRLGLIEAVANEAEDAIRLHFTSAKENVNQLCMGLPLLLVKIKLIHAKVGLVSVVDALALDVVEMLQQDFEFLEILLANFPKEYHEDEKKLRDLVALVDKVATQTECTISSLHANETNDEMILDLLRKIQEIKIADREMFPKVYRSRFPKSHILGFMDFLVEKIKDLLQYHSDFLSTVDNQIQPLQVELESVITPLKAISKKHNKNEDLSSFWAHVADVAYGIEHAVDSFFSSKSGHFWKGKIRLCIEELNRLKMEVNRIKCTPLLRYADDHSIVALKPIQANAAEVDEVIVGLEDEERKIKDKLFGRGRSKLDVISIVGMPGIGKTTLAKKIYDSFSNAKPPYFDVCSSCSVSQAYEKKKLLLDILHKIFGNLEELRMKNEYILSEMLQRYLKGKRYLIFVDDIWSIEAWDDLKRLFPDEETGSKIILTTRLKEVASYATVEGEPHHLRLFRDDESWSLLQKKLFRSETCPPELVVIGKKIAKKCKGLPLSVVLVAGLLQKIEKKRYRWESVEKSFSSLVGTRLGIVELSYRHLPSNLKPCFLYFGRFQEDEEVSVSRLIWLWLAEGFIQVNNQVTVKNNHELAYDYLMDLVGRSLVMKTKTAYDGEVKACRFHDLIYEFCQDKANEENFSLHINEDHHVDSPHCYSNRPSQRHLSIFSEWEAFAKWKPTKSPVRSLIAKVSSGLFLTQNFDVSLILQSFNLLRVLDLRCIYMADFPDKLVHLIHLRYLAIRTGSNSIPSSISNLWNLESFLVKGQRGEVCLPESIWTMLHLKNVQISGRASLDQHKYGSKFFENSVKLANLETFSTPTISNGDDMEQIITRLFNLRKLRCRFSESWDSSNDHQKLCLKSLEVLESLKVLYNGRQFLHPFEFSLPSSLKKLTLAHFRIHWSDIAQLGALPNLEVLKLAFMGLEGEEWQVGEDDFAKLKLLKLHNLNLVRWNVSDGAFPCLEKIVLIKCNEIEEMPIESLAYIPCLRSIEVKWCSRSAALSAKEIQENRVDSLGDDSLGILILPSDWESRK